MEGQPNEDSYGANGRLVAISDGASVSFDSVRWSRILVSQYLQMPFFSPEWLAEAIERFERRYDRDTLPWMQQASFDRGSFASLLAIHLADDATEARVLAIGDSLAVLCDEDRIMATFPYTEVAQFDQNPQLLSTNRAENKFVESLAGDEYIRCWSLSGLKKPAILCMTDALGQWVLSRLHENPICQLRQINGPSQFRHFVERERRIGQLRRDDTTLLPIWSV